MTDEQERKREKLPRDVACPYCGQPIGKGCGTRTSAFRAVTHRQRWWAIGVQNPTYEDRHADYLDGRQRDLAMKVSSLTTLLGDPT